MPIASAATSSSRTERKARPCVESRSRFATRMVTIATAQIQAKSARWGVGDGELAGQAVHQVQRHGEDDRDADVVDVLEGVLEPERGIERDPLLDEREEGDGDEERQPAAHRLSRALQRAAAEERHHTFSAAPRPSRPEGFTSRMRMRIPNATASRQEELV